MTPSLALLFLIACASATPIELTSATPGHIGIHKVGEMGSMMTLVEPGKLKHVSTTDKLPRFLETENIEPQTLAMPVGFYPVKRVLGGWVSVEPSKTEAIFHSKRDDIAANPHASGGFIMPQEPEGLLETRGDAMQQSQQLGLSGAQQAQQLAGRRFYGIHRYIPTRSGWFKVEPEKTEGLFSVKGDAMQQSQQMDATTKERGPKIVHAEPGKLEYIKADAMQQSQQLEGGHYARKFADVYPTRSGWLKVEPEKTEGLFSVKGDQQPLYNVSPIIIGSSGLQPEPTWSPVTHRILNERELRAFQPATRRLIMIPSVRTDTMQQQQQLDAYKSKM